MANMELIEAKDLTTSSATISFTSIPQTYTDLKLVLSARSSGSGIGMSMAISINGSSANFTAKNLEADGVTPASGASTNYLANIPGSTATASTFGSVEVYFPNYTSSSYKSYSTDSVTENNSTTAYVNLISGIWKQSAAITSLEFTPSSGSFVQYSTAYLYGISRVTSGSKATGGIVSSDGTYWYHLFPNTATFTPTQSITADILVVGGGGGGGSNIGGGGGAGGLRYFASESLTAIAYTCTVGAGGVGPIVVPDYYGGAGGTSQFGSLTSTPGGGGGIGTGAGNSSSNSSASSGGNRASNGIGTAGSGQGNIGAGHASINGAGGGGGFSGAGVQGTSTTGGTGGIGTATYSAFAYATGTGDKGYYVGGGGGSGFSFGSGGPFGFGGLGGGGDGMVGADDIPRPGKQSTGGGGGGGFSNGTTNPVQYNNGGSGVIIVRYLI
jgi:hypothetical protein